MIRFTENLEIVTGNTLKWVFYVLDNDNTTMDTTGYDFKMHVRNSAKLSALLILDCTPYLDFTTYKSTGVIILTVPDTITATLRENSTGWYDIKAKIPNGEVYTVSQGKVNIVGSATGF